MSNLWVDIEDLGSYASSEYAYDSVKTASFLLWAMSGRKFSGTTTVTERYVCPIRGYLNAAGRRFSYLPTIVNGEIVNLPNASEMDFADGFFYNENSTRFRVRLRGRKVIKIHTLRDWKGGVIPPAQYYLADHSQIQAAPNAKWSACNVEVTYTYGTPPPFAGKAAAKMLAIELVKMYEGDETCALPQRVTSIARQGVTYTVLDSQDFVEEMRTGVYAIDMFLKSVNPDKARSRSKVFSPDLPRGRRVSSREKLLATSVYDFAVLTSGGSLEIPFSVIDADDIFSDDSWEYSVVVSNWSDTKTTTLSVPPTVDTVEEKVTITATYTESLAALGLRDPGSYTLYASRPSEADPETPEVVELYTGNMEIQLATPVTNIYTP